MTRDKLRYYNNLLDIITKLEKIKKIEGTEKISSIRIYLTDEANINLARGNSEVENDFIEYFQDHLEIYLNSLNVQFKEENDKD
jgi:hypothetical protein